jgi:hypothetical protein
VCLSPARQRVRYGHRCVASPLAPAECGQLRFKIREPFGKRLAVSFIAAILDIAQDPGAVEQQTVALLLSLDLLGSEMDLRFSVAGIRGFNLPLNRLTFPPTCHTSILCPFRPSV